MFDMLLSVGSVLSQEYWFKVEEFLTFDVK